MSVRTRNSTSIGVVIGDSHITERNGRAATLEAIASFTKTDDFLSEHGKVDYFVSVGDLIADPNQRSKKDEPYTMAETLEETLTRSNSEIERSIKIITDINNVYGNDREKILEEITDEDKTNYQEAVQDLQKAQTQAIAPILNAHGAVANGLSALAEEADVYMVKGNWDIKYLDVVADEVSKKSKHNVTMLENVTSSAKRTSTGKVMEFQGTTNTFEVPPVYAKLYQSPAFRELVQSLLINYETGHNLKEGMPEHYGLMHDKELKRLRTGKRSNVLVTHTFGSHDMMNDNGEWNGDKGYSTSTYADEVKPDIIYTGHKHKSLIHMRNGQLIARFGPNQIGTVETYDDTDRVKNIAVYDIVEEKSETITYGEAAENYNISF